MRDLRKSFTITTLIALVASGAGQILSDFRVPITAKRSDFDSTDSVLGKLMKFNITGENKPSDVLDLLPQPKGKFQSILTIINDKSVFNPKKDDPKGRQIGFRRLDLLPIYDPKKIEVGKKAYHHSFKLTKPLETTHGYLLASVEHVEANGGHVYDIFYGSDFINNKTDGTPTPNADQIRVRDMAFKEIFSAPMKADKIHNFAVEVDWDKFTLQAYYSTDDEPLVKVGSLTQNDKAKNSSRKCEWHIQTLKMPIPKATDSPKDRDNVPFFGFQTPNITEEILHLRNFVENTDKSPVTTNPDGPEVESSGNKTSSAQTSTTQITLPPPSSDKNEKHAVPSNMTPVITTNKTSSDPDTTTTKSSGADAGPSHVGVAEASQNRSTGPDLTPKKTSSIGAGTINIINPETSSNKTNAVPGIEVQTSQPVVLKKGKI